MGFWKVLGGIALVAAAPLTGGASLAAAAAAAVGGGSSLVTAAAVAGVPGAIAVKASEAVKNRIEEGKSAARAEGVKAGEAIAADKYEKKYRDLAARLQNYKNFDEKVLGFYAVGLAISNADGHISEEELKEIDGFVAGCLSCSLPPHIKGTIASLRANPPSLERAVKFALDAAVPRQDIDDIIELVAMVDGNINYNEQSFIRDWKTMAQSYAFV